MLQEVSWGMVYGEILGYGFPVLFQIPCLETDPGEICGQTWKGCTHRFLLQCSFIKIQCWKEAVIRRGAGCVSFDESGLAMGHHPWVKNDSADTVWGCYRHSAGDAGDATERNRGSKLPKVSWKRLRTDTDFPWTCFHFLLCGFSWARPGRWEGAPSKTIRWETTCESPCFRFSAQTQQKDFWGQLWS